MVQIPCDVCIGSGQIILACPRGLMPPARVIAGPRALLTSTLLVTRVPCRELGGAGGRTLAHKQRLAPVGRSQVPAHDAFFTGRGSTVRIRWHQSNLHKFSDHDGRSIRSRGFRYAYLVALAAYRAAVEDKPQDKITLRQARG
jgi:hypothetical protein